MQNSETNPIAIEYKPNFHPLKPMKGQDPYKHRSATPLELLYDLTIVISFGIAAEGFAHLIAENHIVQALAGFTFAMFAVIWAWVNFTWFASAFDTDDWLYRVLVMVQMIGVVILGLGLKDAYESIDELTRFDNVPTVTGYVIMRIPLIILWLRVAKSESKYKKTATTYASILTIIQILWCLSLLINVDYIGYSLIAIPLILLEIIGPVYAEKHSGGTPWNAHHIAERYGLLAIIALGEVLIGTVAALQSLLEMNGWSISVASFAALGVTLTFGLWWIYFNLPAADLLDNDRSRSFAWGYGHIVVYSSITAIGAGLHVIALYLEKESKISDTEAILSAVIPSIIYFTSIVLLAIFLLKSRSWVWWILAIVLTISLSSVVTVWLTNQLLLGLLVLTSAPWIGVLAQEINGRRVSEQLDHVQSLPLDKSK